MVIRRNRFFFFALISAATHLIIHVFPGSHQDLTGLLRCLAQEHGHERPGRYSDTQTGVSKSSGPVFTNHSLERVCLIFLFSEAFECNITSDWLNCMV